jgi:hypothetical protein
MKNYHRYIRWCPIIGYFFIKRMLNQRSATVWVTWNIYHIFLTASILAYLLYDYRDLV